MSAQSCCAVPGAKCGAAVLVLSARHEAPGTAQGTRHQAPHKALSTQHEARSDSLKVLLDLPPRQPKHDRPAVRADGRVRRGGELREDVHHLLVGQRVVRLHGGVACDGGGHLLECRFGRAAAVEAFEVLAERAAACARLPRRRAAPGAALRRSALPPNSSTENPRRSRSAARPRSAWRAAAGIPRSSARAAAGSRAGRSSTARACARRARARARHADR